jgi:D-methionine transport system ATP-binding protein
MITVEHLSKHYTSRQSDTAAIEDVSLDIPQGAIFGIIGQSGAGKSTLLRCLNMLIRPTSGEVLLEGKDLGNLGAAELRSARRGIGMVFQQFNLLESRTAAGNVALPLELAGVSRASIRPRVAELLRLVGLEDKAGAYPAQLSGGQKQRVGIARALANSPRLLLCDEPTSALDANSTASILRLLKDVNDSLGLTTVIITHDLNVVRHVCTQVAVLSAGRIVEAGPVDSVMLHPKTEAARSLMASVFPDHLLPELVETPPGEAGEEVLRVQFLGDSASRPIISGLIRTCGVEVNILSGTIDRIGVSLFGRLTIKVSGSIEQITSAHEYLISHECAVEVINRAV